MSTEKKIKKDPNIEALEALNGNNNFLSLLRRDGRQIFNIDVSKTQWVATKKTYWLRWGDEYYISLSCIGESAGAIEERGSQVKDRASELFRCLNPSTDIIVIAKDEESGEEGFLSLNQKKLRDKITESVKASTINKVNFEVVTAASKDKKGKETYSRTPIVVDKKKGEYISDLILPEEIKPSDEAVRFYFETVERLARGEKLDPDETRREYFEICKQKEDTTNDLDAIFGETLVAEKSLDEYKADLDELIEKHEVVTTKKMLEKSKTIIGIKELIKKIKGGV